MPTSEDRLSHALYHIYQMFLSDARNTPEGNSAPSQDAAASPVSGQSNNPTQVTTTTQAYPATA